jgi:hypothetical protein
MLDSVSGKERRSNQKQDKQQRKKERFIGYLASKPLLPFARAATAAAEPPLASSSKPETTRRTQKNNGRFIEAKAMPWNSFLIRQRST